MTQVLEQQGYPENLWDMGRLCVNAYATVATGVAGASLLPTVVNPGVFALVGELKWSYLFSIWFGTDTALTITVYSKGTDPGLNVVTAHQMGRGGGPASWMEAQVAALPGNVTTLWPVQLPAGFAGEILYPAWLVAQATIVVATPAVAANVTCAMKWIEMGPYSD